MQSRSIRRPDVDVDIVRPVITVIAQDMPALFIASEPGGAPASSFVAEVLDLRIAEASGRIPAALSPFIGPVVTSPADLGP